MTLRGQSRLVCAAVAAAALAGAPAAASSAGQDPAPDAGQEFAYRLETRLDAGSRIGVTVQDVAEGAADAAGPVEGAVVSAVRSGSAAGDAGLEAGDVVVEFDGERVRGARQFARLVRETPAGREVAATVVRGAERREVRVTPERGGSGMAFLPDGAREGIERAADALRRRWGSGAGERPFPRVEIRSPRRLGVRAQAIDGQLAAYFGIESGSGVLIASVEEGSAAARAGLRAGDVITAVGEHEVADLRALRRRLSAGAADEDVVLTVVRDGMETRVTAQLEAPEQGGRPERVRI